LSRTRRYPEEVRFIAGYERDALSTIRIIADVRSQAFEEREEFVRWLEAPGRNIWRGNAVQRLLLQLQVGMDVDLSRPDVLMAHPQGDDGAVDAGVPTGRERFTSHAEWVGVTTGR